MVLAVAPLRLADRSIDRLSPWRAAGSCKDKQSCSEFRILQLLKLERDYETTCSACNVKEIQDQYIQDQYKYFVSSLSCNNMLFSSFILTQSQGQLSSVFKGDLPTSFRLRCQTTFFARGGCGHFRCAHQQRSNPIMRTGVLGDEK